MRALFNQRAVRKYSVAADNPAMASRQTAARKTAVPVLETSHPRFPSQSANSKPTPAKHKPI